MKRWTLFLLAICYSWLAFADGVTFKKIWLEHNAVQNGEKGLKVHIAFDISGMKGQNCKAIAYFDYPKGTGVKDTNGRYRTTDGNVCASTEFVPGWPNTSYSDLSVFIPLSELHLLPGKRTYYTRVFIQVPSGRFLGNSDFASFVGTGPDNNQNYYANNSSNNGVAYLDELSRYSSYDKIPNNLGTIVSSERNVADNGQITYTYHYDNGWQKSLSIATCPRCFGDGRCKSFHGVIGGPPFNCMMCGNTGTCGACKGSGKWIFTTAINLKTGWGYSLAGEKQYYGGSSAGGYSGGGSSGGYSGSSSGGSSGSSVYTKCTSCNGTGRCSSCSGRGHRDYMSGHDSCVGCNGTGRCPICYGRGKL